MEETGWATQTLFLNGKIAEGEKKQAEQQTHTHTRQAVRSKAAPTDTHTRTESIDAVTRRTS